MVNGHSGENAMRTKDRGQSIIEMTFVMVAICLLALGMVHIFRYVGMDLAERRWAHEDSITTGTDVETQLSPNFYREKRMNSGVRY